MTPDPASPNAEDPTPPTTSAPIFDRPPTSHLPINNFDWTYNPSISLDDNFIDLACLTARSSISQKGHMGAVIVKTGTAEVLAKGINTPLYLPPKGKSIKASVEIHAEANAITSCAS
ncbi:hypothetical protein BDK51DRAFT_50561 [Blyttiomyces helicus]|uniref:CMP/dCMP-type deaminase domain-containing protein n=1 Tax=Blyttiomyces helicus TaxID=388810 RepID=A0A4P9VW12_9FUNG|nr:hypothetical protein BDK51DRAFT_50561 [Blyttiomyces helicus]|eukprot:RKO82853.1 hypothetical protein BDK51DRAFT_50561 [Blyttiomyces helicus]